MGYYGTICQNCGGAAIFFSWGPTIECSTCRSRYDFVSLLAAKIGDEEKMASSCTNIDVRELPKVD